MKQIKHGGLVMAALGALCVALGCGSSPSTSAPGSCAGSCRVVNATNATCLTGESVATTTTSCSAGTVCCVGGTAGTAGSGGSTTVCADSLCSPLEECGTITATGAKVCVSKSVPITGGYTIDATETTSTQYRTWLASAPTVPPPTVNDVCGWKTGYNRGTTSGNLPIMSVDWCDGWAYCYGVGKRLCGQIGGGALTPDFGNPYTQGQWWNACAAGVAANIFPYGTTYQAGFCNEDGPVGSAVAVVGSFPKCTVTTPGYTGVFDLSGNVAEWIDACDTYMPSATPDAAAPNAAANHCGISGGGFYSDVDTHYRCDTMDIQPRKSVQTGVGFRCCSL